MSTFSPTSSPRSGPERRCHGRISIWRIACIECCLPPTPPPSLVAPYRSARVPAFLDRQSQRQGTDHFRRESGGRRAYRGRGGARPLRPRRLGPDRERRAHKFPRIAIRTNVYETGFAILIRKESK